MIRAVVFDVGGTMHTGEDDAALNMAFSRQVLQVLDEGGIRLDAGPEDFYTTLSRMAEVYKARSEESGIELPGAEIWGGYFLKPYHVDMAKLAPLAEKLSFMYDYSRVRLVLRPHLKDTIEKLHDAGLVLGVISNIISLTFVPIILEEYGIMPYMSCVVLSSVSGVRKPKSGIFRIAEKELGLRPEELAYVGDTVSRDVIGARNAGWRLMIQISNPSTAFRDKDVKDSGYAPDYRITDLAQIPDIIARENKAKNRGTANAAGN